MKIPLSKKATLPEGHTLSSEIGRYLFTSYKEDLYLIGLNNVTNLSKQPIREISVVPVDSTFRFNKGEELEHALEEGIIYYFVSYNGAYFLFDELTEAIELIAIITQFKALALMHKWS